MWHKCHVVLNCPEVKLPNIFKVPEVPKEPVVEEKPAVPIPEEVEPPPPEGTRKTANELATCDYF